MTSPHRSPTPARPESYAAGTDANTFLVAGTRVSAPALAPGLHVVATPIGNLGDVTLRALETLAGADVIACEDTRMSRRLTERYGITTPLVPYHDHNGASARPKLLARLAAGHRIALISDAGTPLVSDPGFKLVVEVAAAGHKVHPLPGASALLAALVAAGLPTDRFLFDGFLPPKAGQRAATAIQPNCEPFPATLVLYETGPRLRRKPRRPRRPAWATAQGGGVPRTDQGLSRKCAGATLTTLASHYGEAGPLRRARSCSSSARRLEEAAGDTDRG